MGKIFLGFLFFLLVQQLLKIFFFRRAVLNGPLKKSKDFSNAIDAKVLRKTEKDLST